MSNPNRKCSRLSENAMIANKCYSSLTWRSCEICPVRLKSTRIRWINSYKSLSLRKWQSLKLNHISQFLLWAFCIRTGGRLGWPPCHWTLRYILIWFIYLQRHQQPSTLNRETGKDPIVTISSSAGRKLCIATTLPRKAKAGIDEG